MLYTNYIDICSSLQPIELPQPDAMLSHLRSAQLKIHEVPFGLGKRPPVLLQLLYFSRRSADPKDLSSSGNGERTNTESVRVATLSNLLEELCGFYVLRSLTLHLDCMAIDSSVVDFILISKSL